MNSGLRCRSATKEWTCPVSKSMPANRERVPWRTYDALALPLGAAVRKTIEAMVEAHSVDPALQAALMWQVPDHVSGPSHSVEQHFFELTKAYLEDHRDEVRPKDLELAAFFTVQTVRSLTHATWIAFPERLRDGRLTDELTDLILRYLAKG